MAQRTLTELESDSSKKDWSCKDALPNWAKLTPDVVAKPLDKQIPAILFSPAPSVF